MSRLANEPESAVSSLTRERVLVLDFGEMIFMGPPGEVQRDPAVIAAYLGDEAGFAAATE